MIRQTITCVMVLAASLACAQDLPDDPMHEPPPDAFGKPGLPPEFHHPPPPPRGKPVDRLMRHMEKHNPEEFERLQQLQQEDPEAFHKALRFKLEQERFRRRVKDYPDIDDAFGKMPHQDRERFVRHMRRDWQEDKERGPRRKNPEIAQLEEETKELAAAYKGTDDPAQQEAIKQQLVEKLEAQYTLREAERQKHIVKIEEKLEKLKKAQEKRAKQSQKIVEKRLEQLLDEDEKLEW